METVALTPGPYPPEGMPLGSLAGVVRPQLGNGSDEAAALRRWAAVEECRSPGGAQVRPQRPRHRKPAHPHNARTFRERHRRPCPDRPQELGDCSGGPVAHRASGRMAASLASSSYRAGPMMATCSNSKSSCRGGLGAPRWWPSASPRLPSVPGRSSQAQRSERPPRPKPGEVRR